jgi:hypothetical protein
MSKNIIKTIKIEIAGTEVEVTPEQAKSLHAALAGLLGLDSPKIVEKEVWRDRYYPYWPYQGVTWTTYGTANPTNPNWTVSYLADSSSASLQIN